MHVYSIIRQRWKLKLNGSKILLGMGKMQRSLQTFCVHSGSWFSQSDYRTCMSNTQESFYSQWVTIISEIKS